MKRFTMVTVVFSAVMLLSPVLRAQEEHFEVGAFADFTRLHNLNNANFVGVGGRAAVHLFRYMQLEADGRYDFERGFISSAPGIVSGTFARSNLRVTDGLFGPKVQTGIGPVRVFFTAKGGFVNFGVSNQGVISGFPHIVSGIPNGGSYGAFYPGGGVEFFAHWFGIRAEVGDIMYVDNGANHNLAVTFGPQFRW
jgi:hypothetical protein